MVWKQWGGWLGLDMRIIGVISCWKASVLNFSPVDQGLPEVARCHSAALLSVDIDGL